jgi:hypothetical protein
VKDGERLALLVLLGAGAWYVTRTDPVTGRSVADDILQGLGLGSPSTGPIYGGLVDRPAPYSSSSPASGTSSSSGSSRTGQIIGLGGSVAAATLPALVGGGGTAAAAGSSAAAGGAGLGLAGALTITGVAAGAAVLAWAIISKGLFRGGEEGIHVNPARQEYLQAFNTHYGFPPYDPGLGDGRGFAKACGDVGMPGYEADRLLRRIHAADKDAEWKAATDDATVTFEAYERLKGAATLPAWRQQQLAGAVVFANGQTQQQLVAATISLGSGYADLVQDYMKAFL